MQDFKATLLVVEDAPSIRLLLSSGLGREGYRILQAADGAEGLAVFREHQPDLVLMDVTMPVMDGFEACRLIRQSEMEMTTPILMLTGSDDLNSIQTAFDAGATDFITKPINLPLLQQRIRYALRDAERERALRRVKSIQDNARTLAGLAFWEWNTETDELTWSTDTDSILYWMESVPSAFSELLQTIHPDDQKRLTLLLSDALHSGTKVEIELRARVEQEEYLLRMVGQREGDTARIVGAFQDVTAQRKVERQVSYLNYHDPLTGLPNRRLFLRDLEESLAQVNGFNATAVMAIEVLRLHHLQDAYGSEATDQLLSLITNQLQALLPKDALLARLEGGFFAIRLHYPHAVSESFLQEALTQMLQPLDRPWMIDTKEVYLNFSAGVSHAPQQSLQAQLLLSMAKRAQRDVRPSGNISLAVYRRELEDALHNRLSLEAELRRAVEQQEFHLVYQPQLDLATERIVGVEALVRWQKPGQGTISPAVFIPVLEEIGMIHQLGEWILHEACARQVAWSQHFPAIRMGINLSPAQFEQSDLPLVIRQAARLAGADTRMIELEITESLAMHSPETTIKLLQNLREDGFKIAIDDFGIGFSSLEYLLRFPLDTLKIDRAFVKDITRGRSDRAIVRALTSLCQGLGLTTIAEGVETQRQRDYLDALGATEIQGYLLSPPLAEKDLLVFLQNSFSPKAAQE
ncbi:putative bifunctional diguanylate cyclase/phosphodiesterase [Nitrincola tapanii]|uniref:GGDEF domain-containing response regulator n=1 Tax=Nitrincola tapanii TaxID=1708751 RepID=A0A5A9W086_9GAMM|nr:EAL domain-containing protein [Nitrincola tapanii]KAA0874136.1 GGDEF domain-containing response regulator [Nitrincola tapanii]